jgi:hypothetical protein
MPRINRKDFLITVRGKLAILDLMDVMFQGVFRLSLEDSNTILNALTDEEMFFL